MSRQAQVLLQSTCPKKVQHECSGHAEVHLTSHSLLAPPCMLRLSGILIEAATSLHASSPFVNNQWAASSPSNQFAMACKVFPLTLLLQDSLRLLSDCHPGVPSFPMVCWGRCQSNLAVSCSAGHGSRHFHMMVLLVRYKGAPLMLSCYRACSSW